MLYVHPSSTCDVCLEGYNCSTVETTPHAIACGHVFCQNCLRALNPAVCPLCRKAFRPDRIKKLHVSGYVTPEGTDPVAEAQENTLVQRVALQFGEGTPIEHVDELEQEVQKWLSGRAAHNNAHTSLRCAISALRRYKELQQQEVDRMAGVREMQDTFERSLAMKDRDVETARLVEASLAAEMQTMHEREMEMQAQLSERESRIAGLTRHLHELSQQLRRSDRISSPLPSSVRSRSHGRVTPVTASYSDDSEDSEDSESSHEGLPPSARHIGSTRATPAVEDFVPPPPPPPKDSPRDWPRQGQEVPRRPIILAAHPVTAPEVRQAGQRGNHVYYTVLASAGQASEPTTAPRMARSRSNTVTAADFPRMPFSSDSTAPDNPPLQPRSRANSTRAAQVPIMNGYLPALIEVPSSQASSETNSVSSASLRSINLRRAPSNPSRAHTTDLRPEFENDIATTPRQPEASGTLQDIPSPESWGTVSSSAHSSLNLSVTALPGRLHTFPREEFSASRPQESTTPSQAPSTQELMSTANTISSWNLAPPRPEQAVQPEPARVPQNARSTAPDSAPAEPQSTRFQDRFAVHREPPAQNAPRPSGRRVRGRPLPTYDPYNDHMLHPEDREPQTAPPTYTGFPATSAWNDRVAQSQAAYDASGWPNPSSWSDAPAQAEPGPPVQDSRGDPRTLRGRHGSESAKSMNRVASDPGHSDASLGLTAPSSTGHRGVVTGHADLNVVSRSLTEYADRSSENTPHPHGRRSRRPSVASMQPCRSSSRGERDAAHESHVGTRTGLQLYASLPPQSQPTPGLYTGEAHSAALARTLSGGGTSRNRERERDGNTTDSEIAYTHHSYEGRRSGRRTSALNAPASIPSTTGGYARSGQSSSAARRKPYEVPLPSSSAASSRTTYSQSMTYSMPSMTPAYGPTMVQGSLGLNFAPVYPASAAVTRSGEESAIRAPKPITSSRGGLLGNLWPSRPAH